MDLHEGCGRTKLFWLLALADSTTLKAMLELRGENQRSRGSVAATTCRFCGAPAQPSLLSPAPVCQDPDCQVSLRHWQSQGMFVPLPLTDPMELLIFCSLCCNHPLHLFHLLLTRELSLTGMGTILR